MKGLDVPTLWMSFRKGNGTYATKVTMPNKLVDTKVSRRKLRTFCSHGPRSDCFTNKLADGL